MNYAIQLTAKNPLEFEFAKYYDVTEFAKHHNPQYNDFEKIYVCVDVTDYWVARIVKDTNEEYETEEGTFLVERNMIAKDRGRGIKSRQQLIGVLDEDDLSNWDCTEATSLDEAIEMIDGGFGINENPFQIKTQSA